MYSLILSFSEVVIRNLLNHSIHLTRDFGAASKEIPSFGGKKLDKSSPVCSYRLHYKLKLAKSR